MFRDILECLAGIAMMDYITVVSEWRLMDYTLYSPQTWIRVDSLYATSDLQTPKSSSRRLGSV